MKLKKIIFPILISISVLIILLFILYSYKYKNESHSFESSKKNLTIITTTGMIKDAVENIGKDKVKVESLMGPGVDPHSYKAAPSDLKKLRNSNIIIYNGLHLEGKMSNILKNLNHIKPTYAAGDALDKQDIISDDEFNEGVDPHIWFDINLWKKVVSYICKILIKHDSKNKDFYYKNSKIYLEKLNKLNQEIIELINQIPKNQKILITAHDAFGYYGRAYGIKVKGLQGISTTSDFGLRDVSNLIKLIISKKIKAIFIETSVPKKPIKAVIEGCKKNGHQVILGGPLYSDAMGEKNSPEGNYIGMIQYNTKTIVRGLTLKN